MEESHIAAACSDAALNPFQDFSPSHVSVCRLCFLLVFLLHYSSIEGTTADVGLDRWVLNNWKQNCAHTVDPATPASAFGGQKRFLWSRNYRWC